MSYGDKRVYVCMCVCVRVKTVYVCVSVCVYVRHAQRIS